MSQFRQLNVMAFCAAAVLALLVAVAEAQPGGGGGRRGGGGMGGPGGGAGRLGLLGSEQVQKELEMVDDQKTAIETLTTEAREEMRTLFGGGGGGGGDQAARDERQKKMTELREKNEKKVQAILLPDQYERLKQLDLQVRGAGALADKEIADALALNDEQKQKLAKIREDFQAKLGELFQGGGGGGDREARQAKRDELRKAEQEQAMAVLTPEQTTKFEQMKGKIIELDRSQIGFGFGGGGRRGGGQGNN